MFLMDIKNIFLILVIIILIIIITIIMLTRRILTKETRKILKHLNIYITQFRFVLREVFKK